MILEISNKFAIAIKEDGKIYYVTKFFFKITSDQWLTTKVDEIPKNVLFDTYDEAHNCLLGLAEFHYFIKSNRYDISVMPIKIVEANYDKFPEISRN